VARFYELFEQLFNEMNIFFFLYFFYSTQTTKTLLRKTTIVIDSFFIYNIRYIQV